MTTREDSMKRLSEAEQAISGQAFEDLTEQSRKVAANVLASYGDKYVLTGQGFVLSVQKVQEATFMWLVAEGYVTLTEKAAASEDELAKRREAKLGKVEEAKAEPRQAGNYL